MLIKQCSLIKRMYCRRWVKNNQIDLVIGKDLVLKTWASVSGGQGDTPTPGFLYMVQIQ